MAVSVQMPKQGNTVEECLLVEWRVREGDTVKQGEALCAIETDKAAFEVESTAGGVVLRLLAAAGELVPVLTDIAVIGEAGEAVETAPATRKAGEESKAKAAAAAASASASASAPASAPVQNPVPAVPGRAASGQDKAVSPRARALAGKLGVDAEGLPGSGIGGRVTSRDVIDAVASGAVARVSPLAREVMAGGGQRPGTPTGIGGLCLAGDLVAGGAGRPAGKIETASPSDQPESVPYKGIRKLIGERMHASLMNHAQLTLTSSADADGLLALRKIYKEKAEAAGLPNISLNDLVSWVVARTLPLYPEVNGLFDKAAAVFTRFRTAHLAVAVDTPRGLMVPVVRDADRLSLAELSRAISALAADCRKGTVNPDNLTGGTFTVSNLGAFGVETFTPVLNSPQAGILGVCAVTTVPAPGPDGGVIFRPRIGLSLTIDHQVVDGAPAARFLRAVAEGIGDIQTTVALCGAL